MTSTLGHPARVCPGRHGEVLAHPVAARSARGEAEAQRAAQPRVQPVGGHDVPGGDVGHDDVVALGPHRPRLPGEQRYAEVACAIGERSGERRASDAAPGPVGEPGLRCATAVDVPDAAQVAARGIDRHALQATQGVGHQALAARLVRMRRTLLQHDDVETGERGVDGRHEPRRAAADDREVDHGSGTRVARAASSSRIRTRRSAAFSTVKTSAVTHASPTSGRANPSTTTAT